MIASWDVMRPDAEGETGTGAEGVRGPLRYKLANTRTGFARQEAPTAAKAAWQASRLRLFRFSLACLCLFADAFRYVMAHIQNLSCHARFLPHVEAQADFERLEHFESR